MHPNLQKLLTPERRARLEEIAQQYKVARLCGFGSVCTDFFREDSDLDFLYELQPVLSEERGILHFELHKALEDLFSRKVDLVRREGLRNPYFIENIEKTKTLIYPAPPGETDNYSKARLAYPVSPERKSLKLLWDVLCEIEKTQEFLHTADSFEAFAQNMLLKSAVKMNLMRIGTYLGKIRNHSPALVFTQAPSFIEIEEAIWQSDDLAPKDYWELAQKLPLLKEEAVLRMRQLNA